MKIAEAFSENKGLSFKRAIFIQSGEPKAHGIFAQDDISFWGKHVILSEAKNLHLGAAAPRSAKA